VKRSAAMLVGSGAALVLAAGGATAGAAIAGSGPVDGAGVIHGCWTNAEIGGSHVLVLQDSGTSCPRERPRSAGTSKVRLALPERPGRQARRVIPARQVLPGRLAPPGQLVLLVPLGRACRRSTA
jgi:hypothetical protein